MDYEKAYKDALERARELKNKLEKNCSLATSTGIESIFPELQESEDESIRKSLIEHLQCDVDDMAKSDCPFDFEAEIEELSKYIAWLEKQGEQQKTKFDLITWKPVSEYTGGRVLATNDIDILVGYINSDGDCESEDCEGTLLCGVTGFVKIEDVLPPKQDEQKPADSYCKDNCKGFQETVKCFADGECKAKRDAENKPIQEIESFEAEHGKYYYCIKDYFCGGRKQASKGDVVQALRGLPIMSLKDASEYFLPVNNVLKAAWSEEDEKHCRYIIDSYLKEYYGATALAIEWLENLKYRVQPHWKPTDGQMQALELVVQYHAFADQDKREKIVALFNDLKKL